MSMGFSGGLVVRNLPANAGQQQTWVQSLGWEDTLQEEMATTPLFLPGKSHKQRSLAGCSQWGLQELDRTEYMWLVKDIHVLFSRTCEYITWQRGIKAVY